MLLQNNSIVLLFLAFRRESSHIWEELDFNFKLKKILDLVISYILVIQI